MDPQAFIRGFALFGFALVLVLAFDGRTPRRLRWGLAIYCLSAINNLFDGPPLLGAGHIGWMWLLALVMFEDRPLTWPLFLPAAGLFGIEALRVVLEATGAPALAVQALEALSLAAGIGLFAHVLFVIVRTWRGDFVETRRRLRLWLAGGTATYGVFYGLVALSGQRPEWLPYANMVVQAALIFSGFAVLLQLRDDLTFAQPQASGPGPGLSSASRQTLERLETLMDGEEVWRRESLTIGELATAAGTSERQLRRLINERLGHRNFTAFLNRYRIAAARRELAQAGERTVSEVAFGVGYTSLGPFNRAFKEETGQTPTVWRKSAGEG